jgi:glucose/arabinose dehydrogenase
MRNMILLVLLAILCGVNHMAGASSAPSNSPGLTGQNSAPAVPGIELQPVITDLDLPVYVTGAGDGSNRLFIVELPGRIKVLAPGATLPELFLDITEKVETGGESGLLGLAFHPRHSENGRFFISYSRSTDGSTVIAEYRVSLSDPNKVEGEERTLLVIPQPSNIHHGGMIEFGPDNYLYVSTGDGNWEDPDNSAQNLEELRGKILRIDIDRSEGETPYSSPESNPYFGDVPGRDEVFASGFRNPWRFSFDRLSGHMHLGDVGHEKREEINLIISGGNYGWRAMEGTLCTGFDPEQCGAQQSIRPLIEYDHSDGRCSVTGGYNYRGDKASLPWGAYVFGDFCSGEILLLNEGILQSLLDTDLHIASFGEDDSGEVYVVALEGALHRIVKAGVVEPRIRIDGVEVRRRSSGEAQQPVITRSNGRNFEIVIRGSGFVEGAGVFVSGSKMKNKEVTYSDTELTARLRRSTLSQPGILEVEVVNPDGARSNVFEIELIPRAPQ